ncbi:hypothetical protein [Paenibacillus sp. MBLB4367]|uniref:hypothetical protein n=1 Tax=Paenibacillus sp. MBLB4367 TaxID=3384767 RepID=UPI0039082B60
MNQYQLPDREGEEAVMPQPETLGTMVKSRFGQAAVILHRGGRHTVCFVSNGAPAIFQEFDLLTGETLFRAPVPNTDCCWGISSAADETVYVTGTEDGILYRYCPDKRQLEPAGATPADRWVWQLRCDGGRVYGATYPDCAVFEYDCVSGEVRDYGTVMPGEQYARGLTVDGEWIYAGTGSVRHVVRVNRITGAREELELPGITGRQGFVDRIWALRDYLLVSSDFSEVRVFRKHTLEPAGAFVCDNELLEHPEEPGTVYYKSGTSVYRRNLLTGETAEAGLGVFPEGRVKAMKWLEGEDRNLALVTGHAEAAWTETQGGAEGRAISYKLSVEAQPIEIQSLETGPDGKLYIGGYHRGFTVYDPQAERIERTVETFPQTEGIGFLDGNVYLGTYTKARMYRYDPELPFRYGETPRHNPGRIGVIGHRQDRPFAIASGGGKLFVGTIADYGIRGGALSVYDPCTEQWSVHPDIVEDQSVIGLAYLNGNVYGGTTLWGGLGIPPSDGPAKMFVWDAKANRKIGEFVPDIPGIDMPPRMIGELSAGPDGLIWGAADGTLFAMEPASRRVVKSKVILPSEYRYSKWRPIFLRWGPDGLLYTTLGRRLVVVRPETMEHKILNDSVVGNMTLDRYGRIYYAQGTELLRLGPAALPE